MNRPFGAAFALGLMLATASSPGFGQAAADQGGSPVSVGASRVPLDAANPRQDRVGRLVYRGGLRLASGDARFGGLSALLVPAEGDRFVAVSDKGRWVSGTLAFNAAGDLTGVGEVTLQAILGPGGRRLSSGDRYPCGSCSCCRRSTWCWC